MSTATEIIEHPILFKGEMVRTKKLVKGIKYDGWVMRWPEFICVNTFRERRADVIKYLVPQYWSSWKQAYRKGARIVKVKLVEVPDKRGTDAGE